RRLLGVRTRTVLPMPARGPVDRALPGEEIAPGLRLLETHLPMTLPMATLSLAFANRVTPARNRSQAMGIATPETIDPRDLLFFDTETTGLAGGTGTRAFMVGAADFHRHPQHGDGLRVRQLLIATMAAESDMLRTFAGWLSPRTVLASYNGRCYDAPLLKTRYRLARLPDPLRELAHVDLLFPSRRRWRGRWENCRLATVEREALGVAREDDLPGSQAPAAWLQYLRGGSSSLLKRVAAHNHQDVVTLALLMAKLVALHAEDAARAD
ncbi:MAG: ribonuclease H-like domain-containing protein, partial [Luteimonas sp.]|nr:ribonuclease H-like domain-containing protein [Luteimonas sp.]